MNTIIFAFDFSVRKPAMVSYINNEINFYVWPLNIDAKSQHILQSANINVYNRNLSPIKKEEYNTHTLIIEHINRAHCLANIITKKIISILSQHNITNYSNVIIANEGFSFGSTGDATLELAGYKYVLLDTLMSAGFKIFKTYPPITIKSIAGCAKKGSNTKDDMINALSKEDINAHKLFKLLNESPELLKKKTAYVTCIDDIADSYWCLKTTMIKEGIIDGDIEEPIDNEEDVSGVTNTLTLTFVPANNCEELK